MFSLKARLKAFILGTTLVSRRQQQKVINKSFRPIMEQRYQGIMERIKNAPDAETKVFLKISCLNVGDNIMFDLYESFQKELGVFESVHKSLQQFNKLALRVYDDVEEQWKKDNN